MIKFFKNQSTEARRDLILHGSITNTLIMLSIPTLMMGLVQSLMPLMDGLFINNVAGDVVASSVTFSEPIINMMSALSQGFGVAAMAIIGQHNGLGDLESARKISVQILVFGLIIGILMGPTLYFTAFMVSNNLHPDIKDNVFLYLSLYSFAMPFNFMAAIYNGIKNANGKPEATFIRMLIMLILKIVFNAIFVYAMRLGIVGSVASSFCTYIIVTTWMYYDLFIKESEDKLTLKGFKMDFSIFKEITIVGVPSMISTFLTNLGFFLINSEVAKYGPIVLNGQGIANNITAVCFNMPAAFASSVTTMVSMNIGAKYAEKAKKSCLIGCILSGITALVLIAIIVPLSSNLTVLFTREKDVLEIANNSLHIYTYSVLGFGICMVIQGAFIGLGRTKVPLVLGILRVWLLRYLFVLITDKYLQYYAVFWGNLFSNYMAALIAIVIILKTPWVSVINIRSDKHTWLKIKNWIDRKSADIFPKEIGLRKNKKAEREKAKKIRLEKKRKNIENARMERMLKKEKRDAKYKNDKENKRKN